MSKWTPEQRKAASERAKAAIAAKKEAAVNTETVTETVPEPLAEGSTQQSATVTLTQEQFQMMLDRLQSKEASGPTIGAGGKVQGVIERFPTNPSYYENPIEALYELPELKRFSVRENYVLRWTCSPTQYQTASGTWYSEPRFELTLLRRQYDENGAEVVKKDAQGRDFFPRIIIGRASFFEDPPANLVEAELAGLTLDDVESREFQDKMRMYRYKFWLVEKLMPKSPIATNSRRHVEVIGGKVYEIEDSSLVL